MQSLSLVCLFALTVLSGCVVVAEKAKVPMLSGTSERDDTVSQLQNLPKFQSNSVYFPFDRFDIPNDQIGTVQTSARQLNGDSDLVVELSGHADERGSESYNAQLGLKRAQAVALALVRYGISSDRIAIISYGEALPAVSGAGEGVWSRNRRVQLAIYPASKAAGRAQVFENNRLNQQAVAEIEQAESISSEDKQSPNVGATPGAAPDTAQSVDTEERDQNDRSQPGESLPAQPGEKPRSTICDEPEACDKKGLGIATGTGFFVTNDGYLLTNQHVVSDSRALFIVVGDQEIPAVLIDSSEKEDIALLKADVNSQLIPIATDLPKKGEEIAILGYPNITVQGNEQKATFGHINALSGIQNDPRWLQFDAPIQPGNSGSPVISSYGEVVGIATATLKQDVAVATSGTLAQGVNYAVRIERALPFYELAPGYRLGASIPRSIMSPVQIVDAFEQSVVLVINYHEKGSTIQAERKKQAPELDYQPPQGPAGQGGSNGAGGAGGSSGDGEQSSSGSSATGSSTAEAIPALEAVPQDSDNISPDSQARDQFIYQSKPEQ